MSRSMVAGASKPYIYTGLIPTSFFATETWFDRDMQTRPLPRTRRKPSRASPRASRSTAAVLSF
ncbi:hypothetical protein HanRHA438_Chr09g0380071 [Helianthus annuus]|nr:hypothetical protein HanIR_Chr09g0397501 [Helianthus annuus]KAJ0886493.1 hypothetical protein HanRHA438_Chr09g0380071 [Helianthus annuus]